MSGPLLPEEVSSTGCSARARIYVVVHGSLELPKVDLDDHRVKTKEDRLANLLLNITKVNKRADMYSK